jgi:phage terminase Nu1 subunit (DNA packaging protein)
MSEENNQPANEQDIPNPNQLDPAFFTCVNEYLELTNKQARVQGLKRISMASLYAAARFNAHVYLANAGANAAADRPAFLDYMTTMYRRMLNEHLDGLGAERGIDVGESELAEEYKAAGFVLPGKPLPESIAGKGEGEGGDSNA